MKKLMILIFGLLWILLSNSPLLAQNGKMQQLAIPLTHPDKPGKLKVQLIRGSIHVESYNGKTVIIRYLAKEHPGWNDKKDEKPPKGMKMIQNHSFGLDAQEADNSVSINSSTPFQKLNLTVQVPEDFSLNLTTVSGNVEVSQIHGSMDINSVNGDINLKQVSGSANVNTINGKITALFDHIDENVPMAFTTLNGDVDISLPANAKFTAKMKTDRGNIYTGFNMNLSNSDKPVVVKSGDKDVFKVTVDNWQYGKVNGGGPEILMKSFNGSIYVRKQ